MWKHFTLMGCVCLWVLYLAFSPLFAQEIPDTLKIAALRVEFQPDNLNTTTGDGRFDLNTSTEPFQIDPPPHNKAYFEDHLTFAKNYFNRISKGKMVVTYEVFPRESNAAYQLDLPMNEYNPNTSSDDVDKGIARLLRDALQKADEDTSLNFSQFNTIVVFHAGVGRDIDLGLDETPQDIPSLYVNSQFLQQHLGVAVIEVDNGTTQINHGIILPETESQDGIQLGLNGILISNLGSHLGFPDLFSPSEHASGVGRFALMDAGLFNGDGLLPALPMAWTRIFAGWEQPQQVYYASGDVFEVAPTLANSGIRVYQFPINQSEYFLVENRFAGKMRTDSLQLVLSEGRNQLATMREVLQTYFPDKAVFSPRGVLVDVENPDIGLPGSGLLIWHIDEQVIADKIAANRINDDPTHRGIDLEEADGSQDIGEQFDFFSGIQDAGLGWALDFWYRGNSSPLFKNRFAPDSRPNSRSYLNNANSHLTLSDFSDIDSIMSFRATFTIYQANFPRLINPDIYGHVTSLKVVDTNADGAEEIILTTSQNKLLVVDASGRSNWGNDSLQVAEIDPALSLMTPPALTVFPDGDIRAIVSTREGQLFRYRFQRSLNQITIEQVLTSNHQFTTYPVAPGDSQQIYIGDSEGNIWLWDLRNTPQDLQIVGQINEAVAQISLPDLETLWAVGQSGKVYHLGSTEIVAEMAEIFPLVGKNGFGVTKTGNAFQVNKQLLSPETDINQIEAPLAVVRKVEAGGFESELAVGVGRNRLFVYNENLTQYPNFPKTIYKPSRNTQFFIPPLIGDLTKVPVSIQNNFAGDNTTFVVVDPVGLIQAYNITGDVVEGFPLATGDSISVSPAILDIDNDGDWDFAAITRSGILTIWDLSAAAGAAHPQPWPQLYATPGNTNLPKAPTKLYSTSPVTGLLPPDMAFNWPNPNKENFTYIRYFLTETAVVKIKIYDIAGDLVKILDGMGYANTYNEVRWDLTNVQSGVYLAQIEAKSKNLSASTLVKIAVIK
jgi:M6 family metalloprotease-like protein